MERIKEAIKRYLDDRAATDEQFAVTYAKKGKNIEECVQYIIGEASKRGGRMVCMPDDEVYGMAVHYYDEDEIKVHVPRRPRHGGTSSYNDEELTEEEKKEAHEAAIELYKAKCLAKIHEDAKKAQERKLKAKESRRKEERAMPSLFDL